MKDEVLWMLIVYCAHYVKLGLSWIYEQSQLAFMTPYIRLFCQKSNLTYGPIIGGQVTTEYLSTLYIEPQFPERTLSSSKDNALKKTSLFTDFQANGAEKGRRNRTVFVLAVGLSCESVKTLTVRAIADQLRGGVCGVA